MRANTKKLTRLFERAIESHRAGDLAGARRGYLEVLKAAPDQFDALHYLGLLEAQSGRHAEAIIRIRQALSVNPRSAQANSNLGCVFLETHRHEEALACFERALTLHSGSVEAHFNRGNALRGLQRRDAALESYDAALRIEPRYVPALVNKGTLLEELGREEEAISSLKSALALKSDQPGIYLNLGLIERKLNHYEQALAHYDQALALAPGYADALNNRGNVLVDLQRHKEALASFDRALAVNPDDVETLCNRAGALMDVRQFEDAVADYSRVIALRPDHADAHMNDGVCRLMLGDFTKGWEHYEWRWKTANPPSNRSFPQALWDGKFVDGVLFTWGEQGLGDQILHAGMIDDLRKHAKHLVVDTKPRLVNLFKRSFSGIEIVAEGEQPRDGRIDAQVPMGSIGQYLRKRWEDFPARDAGYLVADAERARDLRDRLTADGRFVIGVSWISTAAYHSEQKSARLRDFEPILKLPGTRFVDLQYGDTQEEREAVKESTGVEVSRLDEIDNRVDIDGLAALITACDVVVSVSNTTVHLAGALGRKVLLLLPYSRGSLWYWHAGREDSPWYSSVRIIRQLAAGDWAGVMRRAAQELEALRS